MGVNKSRVSNQSNDILHVLVFNNTDTIYWYYRDFRQPPDDGETIVVDGLAGGAAVKIGVVYNEAGGRFIFDLFRVAHGATLTIREKTRGGGVRRRDDVPGVILLRRGMSIKMSEDHVAGVMRGLQMASNVAGSVNQAGNFGKMVAGFVA